MRTLDRFLAAQPIRSLGQAAGDVGGEHMPGRALAEAVDRTARVRHLSAVGRRGAWPHNRTGFYEKWEKQRAGKKFC